MGAMQVGDHWVILTGAGISADSGLSTFRGGGGLWDGHRVEDVATPEAWERDPHLVWRFYQARRRALLDVEPNAGHHALVQLERHAESIGAHVSLITQNVDDLHLRAGSKQLAMHGELRKLRCEICGFVLEGLEHLDPEVFVPCESCKHDRLRPDIVWFGEMPYGLQEIDRIMSTVTHFLACGTSGAVYPAAGLLSSARSVGAQTWVNALEEPDNLDPRDGFHAGGASSVLPRLVGLWTGDENGPIAGSGPAF